MKHVKLNTGGLMPILGLGTFKIRGDTVRPTLEAALAAGYTSIDTASVYRNEATIAESLTSLLPKFTLQRSDLFITSKLQPKDQGYESCREACLQSLSNLETDYLDLYLIHWPGTGGVKHDDKLNIHNRKQSWKAMEQLHKEGKLKAIGVSNYTKNHMEELLSWCSVKPAVLQTEHHPHLVQEELVKFCKAHDIHFQAYSSLGSTTEEKRLLMDPTVKEIAKKYGKSESQILLKWAVQQDIGVLPKSTNPDHIKDNICIFDFEISAEDIGQLSGLSQNHHYCWDPSTIA